MDRETWIKEARRGAQHYWCYPDLIDDHPDAVDAAIERKEDPFAFAKELGEELDLHEFGPAFGGW